MVCVEKNAALNLVRLVRCAIADVIHLLAHPPIRRPI